MSVQQYKQRHAAPVSYYLHRRTDTNHCSLSCRYCVLHYRVVTCFPSDAPEWLAEEFGNLLASSPRRARGNASLTTHSLCEHRAKQVVHFIGSTALELVEEPLNKRKQGYLYFVKSPLVFFRMLIAEKVKYPSSSPFVMLSGVQKYESPALASTSPFTPTACYQEKNPCLQHSPTKVGFAPPHSRFSSSCTRPA